MSNINNEIEYINEMASLSQKDFVLKCEERYQNIINDVVKKICEISERKIIMLAGPSSSGKTTTANKLSEALEKSNIKTYVISLDDFYLNREDIPMLPDGTRDYETVYALDLPCFRKTVNELWLGAKVRVPVFDFVTGKRSDTKYTEITLGENDAVIIEGLHALNPEITDKIDGKLVKIYISVSSRIYDKNEKIILNKRNLRFVRRLVRDYKFRGSSVENTYKLWKNVMAGEDEYLFPYRHHADIRINTIHLYEPCVLKQQALPLLKAVELSEPYKEDVKKLCKALEKFEDIDINLVPNDSLLREFLGK